MLTETFKVFSGLRRQHVHFLFTTAQPFLFSTPLSYAHQDTVNLRESGLNLAGALSADPPPYVLQGSLGHVGPRLCSFISDYSHGHTQTQNSLSHSQVTEPVTIELKRVTFLYCLVVKLQSHCSHPYTGHQSVMINYNSIFILKGGSALFNRSFCHVTLL